MPVDISPNTTLYALGRGIVSIAEWSGGTPGSYNDVGNCPSFSVEVTESVLEHFSSRSGLKSKDKTVVLETGYNLAFDLDEISVRNLRYFLRGTMSGANVIQANQATDQEFALKFVSDNPVGPNENWSFWKVKLSPGAAFNLIADEWAKMSFKGEGLADATNHASSPFFTVTFGTTTTTTTTTTAP